MTTPPPCPRSQLCQDLLDSARHVRAIPVQTGRQDAELYLAASRMERAAAMLAPPLLRRVRLTALQKLWNFALGWLLTAGVLFCSGGLGLGLVMVVASYTLRNPPPVRYDVFWFWGALCCVIGLVGGLLATVGAAHEFDKRETLP